MTEKDEKMTTHAGLESDSFGAGASRFAQSKAIGDTSALTNPSENTPSPFAQKKLAELAAAENFHQHQKTLRRKPQQTKTEFLKKREEQRQKLVSSLQEDRASLLSNKWEENGNQTEPFGFEPTAPVYYPAAVEMPSEEGYYYAPLPYGDASEYDMEVLRLKEEKRRLTEELEIAKKNAEVERLKQELQLMKARLTLEKEKAERLSDKEELRAYIERCLGERKEGTDTARDTDAETAAKDDSPVYAVTDTEKADAFHDEWIEVDTESDVYAVNSMGMTKREARLTVGKLFRDNKNLHRDIKNLEGEMEHATEEGKTDLCFRMLTVQKSMVDNLVRALILARDTGLDGQKRAVAETLKYAIDDYNKLAAKAEKAADKPLTKIDKKLPVLLARGKEFCAPKTVVLRSEYLRANPKMAKTSAEKEFLKANEKTVSADTLTLADTDIESVGTMRDGEISARDEHAYAEFVSMKKGLTKGRSVPFVPADAKAKNAQKNESVLLSDDDGAVNEHFEKDNPITPEEWKQLFAKRTYTSANLKNEKTVLKRKLQGAPLSEKPKLCAEIVNLSASIINENLSLLNEARTARKQGAVAQTLKELSKLSEEYNSDVKRLNAVDDVYHAPLPKNFMKKVSAGNAALSLDDVASKKSVFGTDPVAEPALDFDADSDVLTREKYDVINAWRHERDELDAERQGLSGEGALRLLVPALNAQKKILSEYFDLLRSAGKGRKADEVGALLSLCKAEVAQYNEKIDEMNQISGETHRFLPESVADDVLAGLPMPVIPTLIYQVADENSPAYRKELGAVGRSAQTEELLAKYQKQSEKARLHDEKEKQNEKDFEEKSLAYAEPIMASEMNDRQFRDFVKQCKNTVSSLTTEEKKLKKQMKRETGDEETKLAVRRLNLQKSVIDEECALLHAAIEAKNRVQMSNIAEDVFSAVVKYNRMASALERQTGETFVPADKKLPAKILAGKPYMTPVAIPLQKEIGDLDPALQKLASEYGDIAPVSLSRGQSKGKEKKTAAPQSTAEILSLSTVNYNEDGTLTETGWRKIYTTRLSNVNELTKLRRETLTKRARATEFELVKLCADAVNLDAEIINEVLAIVEGAYVQQKTRAWSSALSLLKGKIKLYNEDVAVLNRHDDVHHDAIQKSLYKKAKNGYPDLSVNAVSSHYLSQNPDIAPIDVPEYADAFGVVTDRYDEILALRAERKELDERRDSLFGAERIRACIPVLNAQRKICLIYFSMLERAGGEGDADRAEAILGFCQNEVRLYNKRLAELNSLTGENHRLLDESAVPGILEGKPAPTVATLIYDVPEQTGDLPTVKKKKEPADAYGYDTLSEELDAYNASLTRKQFSLYVKENKRILSSMEKERQKLDREIKSADAKSREGLLIRRANLQKNIAEGYFTLLEKMKDHGTRREVSEYTQKAKSAIRIYNETLHDLSRLCAESFPLADRKIPNKILAGESFVPLLVIDYPENRTDMDLVRLKRLEEKNALSGNGVLQNEKDRFEVIGSMIGNEGFAYRVSPDENLSRREWAVLLRDRMKDVVKLTDERRKLSKQLSRATGDKKKTLSYELCAVDAKGCNLLLSVIEVGVPQGKKKDSASALGRLKKFITYYNADVAVLNRVTGAHYEPVSTSLYFDSKRGAMGLTVSAPTSLYEAKDAREERTSLPVLQGAQSDKIEQIATCRKERKSLDEVRENTVGSARVQVLLPILNLQRKVVTLWFELLRVAVRFGDKEKTLLCKESTLTEVKYYNDRITELNSHTGESHKGIDEKAVATVLKGGPMPVLSPMVGDAREKTALSQNSADAGHYPEAILRADGQYKAGNTPLPEEFMAMLEAYLSSADATVSLNTLWAERAELEKKAKRERGLIKSRTQTKIVNLQKNIVDRFIGMLEFAVERRQGSDVRQYSKYLEREIIAYNGFVDALMESTGAHYAHADANIPSLIIKKKPFEKVPLVGSYTENTAAGARALLDDYRGLSTSPVSENRGQFVDTIKTQTENDLCAVASRYEYRIHKLDFEKDLYDTDFKVDKRKEKERRKEKRRLKKLSLVALKLEKQDNERLNAVLGCDTETFALKKRRANRDKLSDIKTLLTELSAERDRLNVDLIALYRGTDERVSDETHEKYDRKFSAEKKKAFRMQRREASAVRNLYITAEEKNKIYTLMDRKSTLIATVRTSEDKIKTLKLKGKEKAEWRREVKRAKNELKVVEERLFTLQNRAKDKSRDTAKPTGRILAFLLLAAIVTLVVLGLTTYRDAVYSFFTSFLPGA